MNENIIDVKMFHVFSVYYHGSKINLGNKLDGKAVQLLQILWLNPENGITRNELIYNLYEDSDVDVSNSFKALVYRLRKYLQTFFDSKDKFIIAENGTYRWDTKYIIKSDIYEFDSFIKRAESEQSPNIVNSLLHSACNLYKGEFLSHLTSEIWACAKRIEYEKKYLHCLELLSKNLITNTDYENYVRCLKLANYIYSDNEIIFKTLIVCLLKLKYINDAKLLFDKYTQNPYSVKTLDSEWLIKIQNEINLQLNKIKGYITDSDNNIIEQLNEQTVPSGPLLCDYSSFISVYRANARSLSRYGDCSYLVIITLYDKNWHTYNTDVRRNNAINKFKDALRHFRCEDVYTQFNQCQFLILFSTFSSEEIQNALYKRLEKPLHKKNVNIKINIHAVYDSYYSLKNK